MVRGAESVVEDVRENLKPRPKILAITSTLCIAGERCCSLKDKSETRTFPGGVRGSANDSVRDQRLGD